MAKRKGEPKVQLSVGVAEALRKRLEAAAHENDRSLSGEIVQRLRKSFQLDSPEAA